MTFEEVLPTLVAGGWIYRKNWTPIGYAHIKNGRMWQYYDHGNYRKDYPEDLQQDDFVAQDWLVCNFVDEMLEEDARLRAEDNKRREEEWQYIKESTGTDIKELFKKWGSGV